MIPDASVNFAWKSIAAGKDWPRARSRHCLAYNPSDKALLLHGGIDWNRGGVLLGDSWQFCGRQWSRVDAREHPPARHRGAMVHDPGRGFSILFGGQGRRWFQWPLLADTWAFAGERWIRRASSRLEPQARCGHAFAFDEEAGVAVLFGGVDRYGKCSPMIRSDDLHGLVLYGGESRPAGPQFDTTWVLECLGSQRG